jgi:hypothetical protein
MIYLHDFFKIFMHLNTIKFNFLSGSWGGRYLSFRPPLQNFFFVSPSTEHYRL